MCFLQLEQKKRMTPVYYKTGTGFEYLFPVTSVTKGMLKAFANRISLQVYTQCRIVIFP